MRKPLADFHRFLDSLFGTTDAQNAHRHNPVSQVLRFGDLRAVDWLLERYPDPSDSLPDEWSIGALAANDLSLLKRLHRAGLDVLAPSRNGTSVIDQAFTLNVGDDARTADALMTLVAVGADVCGHEDALTYYLGVHHGNRLLQAVTLGDADLVTMALDAGADPLQVLQPDGVTILQLLEGLDGKGPLYPFRQPLGERTQRCANLIRARIANSDPGDGAHARQS